MVWYKEAASQPLEAYQITGNSVDFRGREVNSKRPAHPPSSKTGRERKIGKGSKYKRDILIESEFIIFFNLIIYISILYIYIMSNYLSYPPSTPIPFPFLNDLR